MFLSVHRIFLSVYTQTPSVCVCVVGGGGGGGGVACVWVWLVCYWCFHTSRYEVGVGRKKGGITGIFMSIWLCVPFFSGRNVVNRWTFYNHTWHGGASSSPTKRLVCYFHGQGHSEGSYNYNLTIYIIASELMILLRPKLVLWFIITSKSVLCK